MLPSAVWCLWYDSMFWSGTGLQVRGHCCPEFPYSNIWNNIINCFNSEMKRRPRQLIEERKDLIWNLMSFHPSQSDPISTIISQSIHSPILQKDYKKLWSLIVIISSLQTMPFSFLFCFDIEVNALLVYWWLIRNICSLLANISDIKSEQKNCPFSFLFIQSPVYFTMKLFWQERNDKGASILSIKIIQQNLHILK